MRKSDRLMIRLIKNILNMSEAKKTMSKIAGNAQLSTEDKLLMDKLPKRSRKKLRRYHHQRRLEKKLVTADDPNLPNYCLEEFNETEYYYQNGLRKVYPYYFNFSTYAKGRWMGRTILEIFSKEFFSVSDENIKKTIEAGKVTINGEVVKPDFVLGQNHLIQHTCHRHENPILKADLDILVDNENLLVVNKPCSWPIHPCGRYRYNSLLFILQKDYGYSNLRTMYRLDRLTSGVFLLAKNSETAGKILSDIKERKVQKEYVARVVGYFPDGTVECNQSLSCISQKLSIYKVDPGGKECLTTFTRLSYNGKTSVVKCMPQTGRTHQIRIHLQYLGHPIVNDHFYNSDAFGPLRGKGGVCDIPISEIEKGVLKYHNVGLYITGDSDLCKRKLAALNKRELNELEELPEASTCRTLDKIDNPVLDNSANIHACSANAETLKGAFELDDDMGLCENSNASSKEKPISREVLDFNEMPEEPEDDEVQPPPEKKAKVDSSEIVVEQNLSDIEFSENLLTQSTGSSVERTENSAERKDREEDQEVSEETNTQVADRNNSADQSVSGNNSDKIIVEDNSASTSNTCDSSNMNTTKSGLSETACADTGKFETTVIEDYNEEKMFDLIDTDCKDCQVVYSDPTEEDLIMYLHAYRYKGPDWEYSAPLPAWAQEDWQE